MYINLYNCRSDKRRTNKDLQLLIKQYPNVTIDDTTDIINPTFIVDGLTLSDLIFNYLYASELDRYYFVNNVQLLNGGMFAIQCHIDVLETYKDAILNHDAYVVRQEEKHYGTNDRNGVFFDSSYPIRSDVTTEAIPIDVVGNGKSYYLTVNGGVQ